MNRSNRMKAAGTAAMLAAATHATGAAACVSRPTVGSCAPRGEL